MWGESGGQQVSSEDQNTDKRPQNNMSQTGKHGLALAAVTEFALRRQSPGDQVRTNFQTFTIASS